MMILLLSDNSSVSALSASRKWMVEMFEMRLGRHGGNTLTYTSIPHQIRAEGSEGMPESVPGSKTLISFEEMYMKDSEVRLASLFYFSKSMHAAFNNSQFAAGNTASVCHGKA